MPQFGRQPATENQPTVNCYSLTACAEGRLVNRSIFDDLIDAPFYLANCSVRWFDFHEDQAFRFAELDINAVA